MAKLVLSLDGMLIIHFDENILNTNLMTIAINNNMNSFRLIKNPPNDICIDVIKRDPNQIQYIFNQDPDLWKIIVNTYPSAILHRETVTYNLCIDALDKNPELLPDIICKSKLTPKLVKKSQDIINKYGLAKDKQELIMCVIKRYPYAIDHVDKIMANTLCSIYFDENSIKYIINNTDLETAVLLNPNIIKLVKEPEIRRKLFKICDSIELFL